ncbi:hypothetical protein BKA69DRAFT_817704 [Paraphysoderma sedebokerense]|nr:hypothetical protein BKA69DRAFT_817704 [Paraphysoderma sedebokerense]
MVQQSAKYNRPNESNDYRTESQSSQKFGPNPVYLRESQKIISATIGWHGANSIEDAIILEKDVHPEGSQISSLWSYLRLCFVKIVEASGNDDATLQSQVLLQPFVRLLETDTYRWLQSAGTSDNCLLSSMIGRSANSRHHTSLSQFVIELLSAFEKCDDVFLLTLLQRILFLMTIVGNNGNLIDLKSMVAYVCPVINQWEPKKYIAFIKTVESPSLRLQIIDYLFRDEDKTQLKDRNLLRIPVSLKKICFVYFRLIPQRKENFMNWLEVFVNVLSIAIDSYLSIRSDPLAHSESNDDADYIAQWQSHVAELEKHLTAVAQKYGSVTGVDFQTITFGVKMLKEDELFY